MQLNPADRLIIVMLANIQKHLNIRGEVDPDFIIDAVAGGEHWALESEYSYLSEEARAKEIVNETFDILQMWRILRNSVNYHMETEERDRVLESINPDNLDFPGFDGNNEEHYGVAEFIVHKMRRFEEFKDAILNSHWPSIEGYRAMLRVFREQEPKEINGTLNADQVIKVFSAK